MNILVTICARGGSKGLKNKNVRDLLGKPLIAWTIEQALSWGKAGAVIVSTDSEAIAETAKEYGVEVPFIRPQHLAADDSPKLPVIQHALAYMEKANETEYDYVVDLDPTAPLRTVKDIESAVQKLINNPQANNLYSVTHAAKSPYFNMVELNSQGYVSLSKESDQPVYRRQDAPAVYAMNASIYIFRRKYLKTAETVHSTKTLIYEMPEERSIDIDRPIDFKLVEFLMKEKGDNITNSHEHYTNVFSLAGKVAVVTGSEGLLGKEIAKGLSDQGASVIAADIVNTDQLQVPSKLENKIYKTHLDITDKNSVESIINSLAKVDIWINNAYPRTEDWSVKFEGVPYESFQKNVDMHLNGYFLCCQKAAIKMMKQNKGVIINMASIYGLQGPDFNVYEGTEMTNPVAYAAIKGGIINLTRYLASYLGPYNIRVNALCPGGVFDNQPEAFVKEYIKNTPLGRMANSDDIVAPLLFLASDAAKYLTGHALVVDGGWTIV